MNRTVILSTDEKDEYLFFLPIVSWMWNKFGWKVHCAYLIENDVKNEKAKFVLKKAAIYTAITYTKLSPIESYRNETIVQCSRLFVASKFKDDEYLMTSDIDMLPLKDYWNYGFENNLNGITVYGHDLTGFEHYPICYIAMKAKLWKRFTSDRTIEVDILKEIKWALDVNSNAKSEEKDKWWCVDQDIITDYLNYIRNHKVYTDESFKSIERGLAPNSHYPLGRIDRGCWGKSHQQVERIDAHLLRPGYTQENFDKILFLIKEIFPNENLQWIIDYREEYLIYIKP